MPAGSRRSAVARLGSVLHHWTMDHAGWRSRGYIPHCDGAGVVQHIVISTIGAEEGIEANFGIKFFAEPAIAEIVEDAILHFDSERYRVVAWCVMPNHAHIVVEQIEGWPLAKIVHSWKSFTANKVNRHFGAYWCAVASRVLRSLHA